MAEYFDTVADVGSEEEDGDFNGEAAGARPSNGANGIDDSSEEEDDDDEEQLRKVCHCLCATQAKSLTLQRKALVSSPMKTTKKRKSAAKSAAVVERGKTGRRTRSSMKTTWISLV